MRIYDAIKNFHEQFSYEPEIMYPEKFSPRDKFVIAGMGGSNLVADLLKIRDPHLDVIVHRNYGLPALPHAEKKERLFIADSYSGNTEEALDSFEETIKEGVPTVAVATGGALLERAKSREIPYIRLPDTGIQPRSALGFQIKAVVKFMGRENLLRELSELSTTLRPELLESQGKTLAEKLKGSIPIIYASWTNKGIAYNWKIKFNETGKVPAFFNVFPEVNHNEMTGFDVQGLSRELSQKFHFIFLRDPADHPRILQRFRVLEELYRDRGLPVTVVSLQGNVQSSVFDKIFSSLILADWAAYYTAEQYGLEPEQVPMVEEFKKLINE